MKLIVDDLRRPCHIASTATRQEQAMPATKLREIHIDHRSPMDPYEAEERASVAFYGSSKTNRQTGWITAASLQEGPHKPWKWSAPRDARDNEGQKP
jgi:hypothetical protein